MDHRAPRVHRQDGPSAKADATIRRKRSRTDLSQLPADLVAFQGAAKKVGYSREPEDADCPVDSGSG